MGAERRVVGTATVATTVERAWELVCDTSRYADWVEGTLEVTRTDGPARLGSTYDERNRVLGPLTGRSHWTVVEHEPPRRTVHRGEGLALAAELWVEMLVQPLGDDAAEITQEIRYTPALGPLGQLLAAVAVQRSLQAATQRSVERFAELAAAPAAAAAAAR